MRYTSKCTSNQFRNIQEMAEDDDLVKLLASLGSEESKYCITNVCLNYFIFKKLNGL